MNNHKLNLDFAQAALEEYRETLDQFSELLIAENKKYNLTRIDSPQQIRVRHFLDSLAGLSILDELSKKTGKPLKILDIGSGAGFPGLVLAVVRPQWKIISLEATKKKADFQQKICDTLGLKNATILNGRAEETAHHAQFRQQFDAVTARALAAMPVLAELSLGFVKTGGFGLYWKGPSVKEELKTAQAAIKQMGAKIEKSAPYTLQAEDAEPANLSLVICRKTNATPKQYPRIFGIIKKKPL
ncbi:MAG: 16S rRNA (guanine(527)-N(7))-methyltransferase RsmG [Planctomycetales bacterium 4572_13]|nr:MAG: 16S rRNA (guanine(527)-N(7))-methyltransferase RsmG [Planctomycetales bacterium 4572_13]